MQDSRPRRVGPIHGPPLRGRFVGGVLRALPLLAAGALGACGGSGESPSPSPSRGLAPSAVPQRIVSLAPSHTELLFALGAGDRVVGVTRYCDRPAAVAALPRVADATTVFLEPLAGLRPDLVVANADALREALAPLRGRVPFLAVPTDTLEQLLDAPLVLGRAVGREAEGRALRARMDAALDGAGERARGRAPDRVLFVVQRDPFYVAGPGSFVDALLLRLGYRNAAEGLGGRWPTPSAEAILAMAPDAVVDAAPVVDGERAGGGDPDEGVRAFWARLPGLPAVRAGRVRRLRDVAAVRPGPALAEALDALDRSVAPPPGGADR